MPLDFTKPSVTLDFAEKPVVAAVETFERGHVEDLAGGANYVPGDEGLFSTVLETAKLANELQDGGAVWRTVTASDIFGHSTIIGDGTNLRWRNTNAAARNIVVMRHHLSTATYELYHTADIAADASYTPPDEGLFSSTSEIYAVRPEYKFNAAWWDWGDYPTAATPPQGARLGIGDGTNLRYLNTDGANARWVVIMRAIMVT